jgi:hypothetical protein
MSRATRAINSSRSTAITTPIISPAIAPLEMADRDEATLTTGGDERVVRGDDGVVEVGGEEGVVSGGDDVGGVVGGACVVVVMVTTAQSGAERLSSAVEHIGSMW